MSTIRRRPLYVVVLAAVLWAADARAQSFSVVGVVRPRGAGPGWSGDVHGAGSGQVLGLPTQVEPRSYDDVYGSGFGWAAGVGYRLGETGELRIQGSYTSNPAERLQVGSVAGLPAVRAVNDYKAFGMDFGYRQYFGSGKARPFIGASGGFVRLEEGQERVQRSGLRGWCCRRWTSTAVPSSRPSAAGGGMQISLSDMVARAGRHRVQVAG